MSSSFAGQSGADSALCRCLADIRIQTVWQGHWRSALESVPKCPKDSIPRREYDWHAQGTAKVSGANKYAGNPDGIAEKDFPDDIDGMYFPVYAENRFVYAKSKTAPRAGCRMQRGARDSKFKNFWVMYCGEDEARNSVVAFMARPYPDDAKYTDLPHGTAWRVRRGDNKEMFDVEMTDMPSPTEDTTVAHLTDNFSHFYSPPHHAHIAVTPTRPRLQPRRRL